MWFATTNRDNRPGEEGKALESFNIRVRRDLSSPRTCWDEGEGEGEGEEFADDAPERPLQGRGDCAGLMGELGALYGRGDSGSCAGCGGTLGVPETRDQIALRNNFMTIALV
jgi:hypothetical protein